MNLLFTQSIKKNVIILATPINISIFWNIGAILRSCIITQIFRGIVLASTYSVTDNIFSNLFIFIENYKFGWFFRYIHFNGASIFFFYLYVHVGRGLYYTRYKNKVTWFSGLLLLVLIIAIAFLGYVLPINQISYWGASVIINLFSEIPVFGPRIVNIIWGSTSVGVVTVNRFFCFHFIIPFIVSFIILTHIDLLHKTGSTNPLGFASKTNKLLFTPYSLGKDIHISTLKGLVFYSFILYLPLVFGDNENFVPANFSLTPHHIQPEWYFLFAYAILRSVPNKLGGVIILIISIAILIFIPLLSSKIIKRSSFIIYKKILFWIFVSVVILLTWVGRCPVEPPFVTLGQCLSIIYFSYFFLFNLEYSKLHINKIKLYINKIKLYINELKQIIKEETTIPFRKTEQPLLYKICKDAGIYGPVKVGL